MPSKGVRPPSLTRQRAVARPRYAILAVCEGEKTEPDYIKAFAEDNSNMLVVVKTVPGAGVPMSVVKRAISYLPIRRGSRRRTNSFEEHDEIWAVFDCDEHPQVAEATQLALAKGIRVAYSNPCFEVWAILHLADYDAPHGRHEVQKRLAEMMTGYDPKRGKGLSYTVMSAGYGMAVKRAQAMKERRSLEQNERGSPYTDVYELTEKIIANGRGFRKRRNPV